MHEAQKTLRDAMLDLGLRVTSDFVPLSKSRNAGEKHPTLNWRVTLWRGDRKILTTDYSAGAAHAPSYRQRQTVDGEAAVAHECEHGYAAHVYPYPSGHVVSLKSRPILPDATDVVYSLVMDAGVLNFPTYESWAGEYGFDPDSRKGEATYRACLELALALRAVVGEAGLAQLTSACEGY